MNELLVDTLIENVDAHEKKIVDLEKETLQIKEVIITLPDYRQSFEQVSGRLNEVLHAVKRINFPETEMRDLASSIHTSTMLLKHPAKREVLHHHYVPKTIYIAAGLSLILSFVLSGWYMTAENLKQYKTNDTKYRYLKVRNNKSLQQLLNFADSLYLIEPKMRDSVIELERQIAKRFEMMQHAAEMEAQAKDLKMKANKIK